MDFQWDAAKDAANQAKHGVSFLQAAQIFRGRRARRRYPHHFRLEGEPT